MDREIKNCPFCGKEPRIENSILIQKHTNTLAPRHDFEASWQIRCDNCGTSKEAYGSTHYNLKKDGNFEIVAQTYDNKYKGYNDKRQEVIDKWNKRF